VRRFFAEYAEPVILRQLATELTHRAGDGGSELEVLAKLQQLAAEIPSGHHMLLLDRIPDAKAGLRCLSLLNQKERGADDRPSIGIILCAEKDDVEVEFALKTKANPIGVAEYQLQPKLPAEFKGKLPTAKQLTHVVRSVLPERKKK
jgi:hypothetical protein